MASGVSFQGLSTNLQTDKLIDAILQQQQAPLDRMQSKQVQNNKRASLIRNLRTNIQSLNTSISALGKTSFQGRTVVSSDPNGTNVSATASGSATGSYDVVVKQAATKARLTAPNNLTASDASLGGTKTGDKFEYVITNTQGKQTTIALEEGKNTLSGLRDAINAKSSEAGVNASVVQVSAGQYKLVLTANETGRGTGEIGSDSIFLKGSTGNLLGLADAGKGTQGSELANNAQFTLNGLAMERASNTVTDAVEGVTFSFKVADPNKTTTLAVSLDKSGITAALNDVVSKYNAVYKTYKDNAGQGGPFANDPSLRNLINQAHDALMGVPTGLGSDNAFQSAASLGIKTGRDGSMSLDTATLQSALEQNVAASASLFEKVGSQFQSFTNQATGYTGGGLAGILNSIDDQNSRLSRQISDGQARLEKQRGALQLQYANLEKTVGQLQSMGQSLGGLR